MKRFKLFIILFIIFNNYLNAQEQGEDSVDKYNIIWDNKEKDSCIIYTSYLYNDYKNIIGIQYSGYLYTKTMLDITKKYFDFPCYLKGYIYNLSTKLTNDDYIVPINMYYLDLENEVGVMYFNGIPGQDILTGEFISSDSLIKKKFTSNLIK